MEKIVHYTEDVDDYLDELLELLFDKGYFSFSDLAKEYKTKLMEYIKKYIGLGGKTAPNYFTRYGTNLKYITYQSNQNTTWYVFYQEMGNAFLVRYITNNHVSAARFFNL
ncbi:MAG: hypothetical protein LBN27_06080 [Prevotellaceae bacterium]|jgi:hypothetical protein|nr:hypothetical protein [Prevotellaceae bacterium]